MWTQKLLEVHFYIIIRKYEAYICLFHRVQFCMIVWWLLYADFFTLCFINPSNPLLVYILRPLRSLGIIISFHLSLHSISQDCIISHGLLAPLMKTLDHVMLWGLISIIFSQVLIIPCVYGLWLVIALIRYVTSLCYSLIYCLIRLSMISS